MRDPLAPEPLGYVVRFGGATLTERELEIAREAYWMGMRADMDFRRSVERQLKALQGAAVA